MRKLILFKQITHDDLVSALSDGLFYIDRAKRIYLVTYISISIVLSIYAEWLLIIGMIFVLTTVYRLKLNINQKWKILSGEWGQLEV